MKRFYRETDIRAEADGWRVVLDGRPIRTPVGNSLLVPAAALATAIAAEWDAQGDSVVPATMPMMQLACTAQDRVAPRRDEVVAELARYAETDLLCHRAPEVGPLAAREEAAWQPLLDWLAATHGAELVVTRGLIPAPQAPEALAAVHKAVAAHDNWTLAGLYGLTTICGSVVLGLAVLAGRLSGAEAFTLSRLEEAYQIENWGEDAEATERTARLAAEIDAASRYLTLLGEERS